MTTKRKSVSSPVKSKKKFKAEPNTLDAYVAKPLLKSGSREFIVVDDSDNSEDGTQQPGPSTIRHTSSKISAKAAPMVLEPKHTYTGSRSKPVELVEVDSDTDMTSPSLAPNAPPFTSEIVSLTKPSMKLPKKPTLPSELPKPAFGGRQKQADGEGPTSFPDLTTDPLVFNIDISPWPPSKPAPYAFLAHVLHSLSQTRSRILLLNILTNSLRLFIAHNPSSLLPSLYIVSNSLAPPFIPTELGLGSSVLSKALQSVSGISSTALRKLHNTLGDPGDVAFAAKANLRTLIPHPPLIIKSVYETLLQIVRAKGTGAAKQRQSLVEKLLLAAKGEESRYIMRTLSQNLRVGAVRTTILTALARAMILTRPIADGESGKAYEPEPLLGEVHPLPEKGKKKAGVVDEARDAVIEKMREADGLIRRVFVQHPSYDDIAAALLSGGLDGLGERVPLTVGVPLHPTLGSPTRSLAEIYERLGDLPFAAEYKYDGQRAQIHVFYSTPHTSKPSTSQITPTVKIFSRHLEDMTAKYPDLIALMQTYCQQDEDNSSTQASPSSFIIDAEVVAWDPVQNETRSFQDLSNRPRKDVKLNDIKVPVCLFVFDLMYLNGKSLLGESFRARRTLLRSHFLPRVLPLAEGGARLAHVESVDSDSTTDGADAIDAVQEFWEKAVESRCEGLMVKLLDSGEVTVDPGGLEDEEGSIEETVLRSPKKSKANKKNGQGSRRKPLPATYEPDKRTSAWLKLKKDYVDGIGDTLDLVPIGAWHGIGRKAGWWSPILLAVWDSKQNRLVALCKCMSGFTDDFYKALNERYPAGSDTCSKVPLGDYDVGGLRPAVYFAPKEVWECRGADITLSPVSVAALGEVSDTRGLSLRFPRFIRVREDKNVEDATRSSMIADMYRRQSGGAAARKDGKGADDGDLIDAEGEESAVEDEEEESEEE